MDIPLNVKSRLRVFLISSILVCCIGCATMSIESLRDPGYSAKVNRLFVLIRDESQMDRAYAQNLQTALIRRLSDRGMDSVVRIISPLELDENKYTVEIKSFAPDAVLFIQPSGGTRSLRQVIEIYWDASLFNHETKDRIWRAALHASGGSSPSKMLTMADIILARLAQDGIIPLSGAAAKKEKDVAPPADTDKPDKGSGK